MDIDLMMRVYPYFLTAAWVTVQLSIYTGILGLACGALGASMRLSRLAVLRFLGAAYVSVFRGTPALIQLFILYFGGPQIGIQLTAFEAGVIGLGVNIGAYMTETIRGSIIAIDKGQREAARTLGLSGWQAMRKVILPQAQRYIGSTYKPFEMFLLSGVLYMIIIYGTGQAIKWLDRKARIV